MAILQKAGGYAFVLLAALIAVQPGTFGKGALPPLGRDTVLVWGIHVQSYEENFVVRIAEFSPDRFLEWEDMRTQGTIFMSQRDIQAAKGYASANLFDPGVDKRGKDTTTLWLSRQIYRDLKDKGKAKCNLDGVTGSLKYGGDGHLTVDVNRSSMELPVIKVSDDRGSERWFLDQEENPLMVKHTIREFTQTLISITTDRHNTLRWIKGSKLTNPPR